MFMYGLTSLACVLLKCEFSFSRKYKIQYNMNTTSVYLYILIYHAVMQVCEIKV